MHSLIRKFSLLAIPFLLLILLSGCNDDTASNKLNPPDNTDVDKQEELRNEPVSLQTKLDSMKNKFESNAPEDKKKDYAQGVKEVDDLGLSASALKEGDDAYKFELPSASGSNIKLDDLLKDGPVVLIWYRGGWCPYCNVQLMEMQKYLPEIQSLGANLVAISPEQPDSSLSTKEKGKLDYYVLSDLGNKVAREYGIVYTLPEVVQKQFEGRLDVDAYNKDTKKELPLGAAYVIDKNGKITYAFLDSDYKKRAEPEKIIEELKKLKN